MERVAEVLREARAAGLLIHVEADRLIVRGPKRYESLAQRLFAHKPDVVALLSREETDVAWRVATMRSQLPARGAIPFLVARASAMVAGTCVSCGNPLPPDGRYRCSPCAEAARRVVYAIRKEGDP